MSAFPSDVPPVIGNFHIRYPVTENAIPNAHIGFKNGTIAFAFLVTCWTKTIADEVKTASTRKIAREQVIIICLHVTKNTLQYNIKKKI
jgi:hypothetical protein